jgi:hypothetical protein
MPLFLALIKHGIAKHKNLIFVIFCINYQQLNALNFLIYTYIIMTGAFGRTKKTMDSSEYTRIKKASAVFRIPEPETSNIVSNNNRMVVFVTENLSRTIQTVSKSPIGNLTIVFVSDPENPNRSYNPLFKTTFKKSWAKSVATG